jgi:uncharacterized protein YjbI with pentapeptide repeats
MRHRVFGRSSLNSYHGVVLSRGENGSKKGGLLALGVFLLQSWITRRTLHSMARTWARPVTGTTWSQPENYREIAKELNRWPRGLRSFSDTDGKPSGIYVRLLKLSDLSVARSVLTRGFNTRRPRDLHGRDLSGVSLRYGILRRFNFAGANLSGADLSFADLRASDLSHVNLRGARLRGADLRFADLQGADLSGSDLREALFSTANLCNSDFSDAKLGFCCFDNVGLADAKGLATSHHYGPSSIGLDTLLLSGPLPDAFLRGCGVPMTWRKQLKLMANPEIDDFFSAFISYSSRDSLNADEIYKYLSTSGVSCWQDKHELFPGDDLYPGIQRGILESDKLLLLCSEASLNGETGWWVDREITTALERERDRAKASKSLWSVIIPVDLDGYLFTEKCKSSHTEMLRARVGARLYGPERTSEIVRVREALRVGRASSMPPLKVY